MKKASMVVNSYYNGNKLFDLTDTKANRDNCLYPYFLLQKKMRLLDIDLATSDVHPPNESEIIIYNEIPSTLPDESNIKKSFLIILESELVCPNNWDVKKHKYFNKIFTWHDDYVDNKKYFKINFSQEIQYLTDKNFHNKEKLCTMISGNKKSSHRLDLYGKREQAVRWFEKNHPKDFDLYGMGWENYIHPNKYIRWILRKSKLSKLFNRGYPSYKGKIDAKKEVLEKYRFAICYENARDIPGYITEKIFDCFFAGCVPIYWGASNITEHIPKSCFIDKRDFDNYEDLYKYITGIGEQEFSRYLECIRDFLVSDKVHQFSSGYFSDKIIEVTTKNLD